MTNLILALFFLLSLFATLLTPCLSTLPPLHFFYPYLLLLLYQKPHSTTLLHAFGCGLILDLLSSSLPLGFFAFLFTFAFFLAQRFKHLFFIDKILTLPILTFLCSITLTLVHRLVFNIFCLKSSITLKWIVTDLFILPLGDAFFAFVFFALPFKLLSKWHFRDKRRPHSLNFKER